MERLGVRLWAPLAEMEAGLAKRRASACGREEFLEGERLVAGTEVYPLAPSVPLMEEMEVALAKKVVVPGACLWGSLVLLQASKVPSVPQMEGKLEVGPEERWAGFYEIPAQMELLQALREL